MVQKSTKDRVRERQRAERLRRRMIWSVVTLVVLGSIGALIWSRTRPSQGIEVAIMESSNHVPEGTDPGPFNTNPPTSGPHYDNPLPAGFYDEEEASSVGPYPAGHLVHNLEHGYIVIWYNCSQLKQIECGELKDQIQNVMDDAQNIKVVAFPWDSITVPVVMTSWGAMQEFDRFDHKQALAFVRTNRNRAPEPQAQ